MEKTLLTTLKKKLHIRSSLIAISSLDELLGLNDYLSADEILLEIIKKSLREFEISNPLILEMVVTKDQLCKCHQLPGFYEICPNFIDFLDDKITEDRIVLIPQATPQFRVCGYTSPVPSAYNWVTEYRKPYIYLGDMFCLHDHFYLRAICSRPIIPDFTSGKNFNKKSKKSAIYWLDAEDGGARSTYFIDLCMCNLLDYIRQMKASISLPSISVDVFGNVDAAYQELRSRCDAYNLQSSWYGQLWI